jgi:bisphosphoglycerate-dependent phosphoglycerate mutase
MSYQNGKYWNEENRATVYADVDNIASAGMDHAIQYYSNLKKEMCMALNKLSKTTS